LSDGFLFFCRVGGHRTSIRSVSAERKRESIHLRFSFGSNPFPATNVTLSISKSDSGSVLQLLHEGVWTDYEASVIQGWTDILENLAQLV
jgi:hypothetical protein